MEQNNTAVQPVQPFKAASTYGVIMGILLIAIYVIFYTLDINPQQGGTMAVVNFVLTYIVFPFVFIYLACTTYKKLSGGYITFSQALKTGVLVTVIAALVLGIFNIIFNLLFPEIQAEMIEKAKENMVSQNPNLTAEQLKAGMKVAEFMMRPYILLPLSLIIYAFLGLVHSLIVGAIVKKERPGAY